MAAWEMSNPSPRLAAHAGTSPTDLLLPRFPGTDTAKSQANALRRRIDFVVPIGPDPGRQAAAEAAAETVSD